MEEKIILDGKLKDPKAYFEKMLKESIEMEKQTHNYYDGIPQWIRNLSKEDLDKLIEEEEKRLAELNAHIKKDG